MCNQHRIDATILKKVLSHTFSLPFLVHSKLSYVDVENATAVVVCLCVHFSTNTWNKQKKTIDRMAMRHKCFKHTNAHTIPI